MFVGCPALIKAIVRQTQGNRQAVIRQLSDSHKTVILSFLVQPMRLKAFSVLFPVKNLEFGFFLYGLQVLPMSYFCTLKFSTILYVSSCY